MKESLDRELDDNHFLDKFSSRFEEALERIRGELDECFEAVDDLPGTLRGTVSSRGSALGWLGVCTG